MDRASSDADVFTVLQRLEESLYLPETRFDQQYMDELLAPEFVEFGSSGRVWNRMQIIRTDPVEIAAKLPLPDLEIRLLGVEVALVTYRTEMGLDFATAANRSSVWRFYPDGKWRLVFHQATPTNRR
ncbi:MAG: DUF4440 domain-containing protein [Actinomycetes bacterium]|jgi:hypothetical protein|nr:MAG: DUF4440 domain-containing protein [Actinomycetota bacterium]